MTVMNQFTCSDARRRLDDYLDRELSAGETTAMRAHLDRCLRCARALDRDARMVGGVRDAMRRIAMPADARRRLAATLSRIAR